MTNGDPIWPGKRDTRESIRKRYPTSLDYLQTIAGMDFVPLCKERLVEAAEDMDRLTKQLVLVTVQRDLARKTLDNTVKIIDSGKSKGD